MLTLAVLLACAQGLYSDDIPVRIKSQHVRSVRTLGEVELPRGCLYEGRWHTEGAAVAGGDACLRCSCGRGALSCRRRACAPLPHPPPHRCHVLHKRNTCCPELHCPDGITVMEHGAVARFQDDFEEIATPASILHACVEGGTIYAAGSALRSNTACEQCFCLGGARRCVRPRCLPVPPGCSARPAPGACCPQRYYCQHLTTKPPHDKQAHDCEVEGAVIPEGERVVSQEAKVNCTQCFCLRGDVRCQPLSCAPPLLGCQPLLHPGECCPHQYQCEHQHHGLMAPYITAPDNGLILKRNDDRAFHSSKLSKQETTTKNILSSIFTVKNVPTASGTNNHLIATTKVKRKTEELLSVSPSDVSIENNTSTTTEINEKPELAAKLIEPIIKDSPATELVSTPMEQPEGTIRIMINGTINCTAELSNSLPLSINDSERINIESQPRIPILNIESFETHTSYPNDIITDRSVSGDFDENETFTINVTSSLMTNTSHSTAKAPTPSVPSIAIPTNVAVTTNSSKKVKGDYDYDYTEPTLPPSLPNLKIIPFLAADAVVEDKPPKETLKYPMLEREDKFPIYYPSSNTKETPYATRREDIYNPTQYPIFVSSKQSSQYQGPAEEVDLTNTGYSNMQENLDSRHEYTVSSSVGSRIPEVNKLVTNVPTTSSTTRLKIPSMNLFSPPMETEGGFIPKGPGIDEFYSVYSSTPASPVPHLTTSMQLDIVKGECQTSDGRRIPEGNTISLACSECTCAWGELHCEPRPCHTPPGCRRRPASSNSADLCCGELICGQDIKPTTDATRITAEMNIRNVTKPEIMNQTEKPSEESQSKLKESITNISLINNEVSGEVINKTNSIDIVNHTINDNNTYTLSTTTSFSENPTTAAIVVTTTTPTPTRQEVNETSDQSLEYEEDEEDEGFSFGSVLKLLLSDTYETTTTNNKKQATRGVPVTKPTPLTTTTMKPSSDMPFIPLPHRPYVPPKKNIPQNTVNRIDHLVLGEATAIRKTTSRPVTTSSKPIVNFKPMPSINQIITKPTPSTIKEEPVAITQDPMLGPALPGVGPGLLKLAGCNIYGTMYRVGRIIAELSTPCEECRCTEVGIQCKRLVC